MGSPASPYLPAQALVQTGEGTPACCKTPAKHVTRQFTGSKLRLIGIRRSARGLVRQWERPSQAGSRLAGKKFSQSRRPRGKRCWLTSRTLPAAHATPFEQLGARPSSLPAAVPMSTGRTYVPKSS